MNLEMLVPPLEDMVAAVGVSTALSDEEATGVVEREADRYVAG